MSSTPKRLTGLGLVFAFLPDAICLYRAIASLSVMFLGLHPVAPWLFSTALISDLFDGWFWRHYSRYHHWLSRRPYLPCDPLADFTLIVSGVVYAIRYWLQLDVLGVVAVLVLLGIITAVFQVVPLVGTPSKLVFTVCATVATHISCFIMLATTVVVWRVNVPGWLGPVATMVVFYVIFGLIGDKSRLIRRPPPGWRGLP